MTRSVRQLDLVVLGTGLDLSEKVHTPHLPYRNSYSPTDRNRTGNGKGLGSPELIFAAWFDRFVVRMQMKIVWIFPPPSLAEQKAMRRSSKAGVEDEIGVQSVLARDPNG